MTKITELVNILKTTDQKNIPGFKEKSGILISNPEAVPMIIGDWENKSGESRIKQLRPKNKNDFLTVTNFYAGLEEISKVYQESNHQNLIKFNGNIRGKEINNRRDFNQEFMFIGVKFQGVAYSLILQTQIGQGWTYTAKTRSEIPHLAKVMSQYLGPK